MIIHLFLQYFPLINLISTSAEKYKKKSLETDPRSSPYYSLRARHNHTNFLMFTVWNLQTYSVIASCPSPPTITNCQVRLGRSSSDPCCHQPRPIWKCAFVTHDLLLKQNFAEETCNRCRMSSHMTSTHDLLDTEANRMLSQTVREQPKSLLTAEYSKKTACYRDLPVICGLLSGSDCFAMRLAPSPEWRKMGLLFSLQICSIQ